MARARAARAVERAVQIGRFARRPARHPARVGPDIARYRRPGRSASGTHPGARRDRRARGEESMISEPMTLATDYLLAAVTALLALRILRRAQGQNSRWLWGVAFFALALGAALGG